ncbi:acetolactate synthase isozyme 1 large subunit (plasmid) [Antarctobacter heliothermus]|uniref:Acetolactate synthase isozyme 1 large subunit n=1 Tax=Antarctobacter heliothermus TaxID=74033 RepID=A0A222EBX6_9RHOB|nr:thiamine pyrophosphate-binding protein [Antarctobacter heliothermus]ASP23491.1 acetolactate synthase isozyme 1 large subunit [Antarctobacter heliothermus]
MATTVEFMADAFKQSGTPFIAGHPGGETVELMDAARQRDMRYILMKQETAGAILAATWGEITGSPGVCTSTRGPGATNMVNGIAYAWLDRAPLIALTDQYPAATLESGQRQVINHRAVYDPITKWSTTLQAKSAQQQIRRALRISTAPAPGPVQIDLPSTETTAEAREMKNAPDLRQETLHLVPDAGSLAPALNMIKAAKRPILLVGLGVLWDRASDDLVSFAETLGAPVLTTSKCKGVIPEDHPLRAGCIIGGLIERDLVNQADLIITVGLDSVELQPKAWPYSTPLLSLANTPTTDALVPATMEVIGEIGGLLTGLSGGLGGQGEWGERAAATFRSSVTDALNVSTKGLSPHRAMEIARATLPRDTIATCDAGQSRLLVVQKWQSYGPREFLTSNGLGTMGYAIPGALAARLAHPKRPVIAFAGDGGFLMAVADIQTSVKEKLPIIVMVFDDREIALIRVKQELKQIPRFGVELGGLDWVKLAEGFGADGAVAETEAQLSGALSAAVKSGNTTVIAVRIDGSCYVDQFNALREL